MTPVPPNRRATEAMSENNAKLMIRREQPRPAGRGSIGVDTSNPALPGGAVGECSSAKLSLDKRQGAVK